MKFIVLMLIAVALVTCAAPLNTELSEPTPGAEMIGPANNFLAALSPEQRAKAALPFDHESRFIWFYIPTARMGIPLKELDTRQRELAHTLLKTGLSQSGYLQTMTIIELEVVLEAIEGRGRRDPELYYFTIFGTPSRDDEWGWRVEGHHISLNFTIVNGGMVSTTPAFYGANPAEVRQGPHEGLRVLGAEEDIARELLQLLDDAQRTEAIFRDRAFRDIVTTTAAQVEPLPPVGILASQFTRPQMDLLTKLIDEHASSLPDDLAAERLAKLRQAGLENIRFGWAGGIERGEAHYYRVQGPTFLIEYDNAQSRANHAHSVWRDFEGDFGRDLLNEHYRNTAHHP